MRTDRPSAPAPSGSVTSRNINTLKINGVFLVCECCGRSVLIPYKYHTDNVSIVWWYKERRGARAPRRREPRGPSPGPPLAALLQLAPARSWGPEARPQPQVRPFPGIIAKNVRQNVDEIDFRAAQARSVFVWSWAPLETGERHAQGLRC
jgi:hypothetical protein